MKLLRNFTQQKLNRIFYFQLNYGGLTNGKEPKARANFDIPFWGCQWIRFYIMLIWIYVFLAKPMLAKTKYKKAQENKTAFCQTIGTIKPIPKRDRAPPRRVEPLVNLSMSKLI